MKKLTAIAIAISGFLHSATVFAQQPENTIVNYPGFGVNPATQTIGGIVSQGLRIAFIIGLLAVLAMLVFGAVQWIFSGGDKDALSKARGRIIHALVGLLILALTFLLTVVIGNIVNINLLALPALPSLNTKP